MAHVPLTQLTVANYTESSIDAVKDWCSSRQSKRYNNMPLNKLKLLKFEIINKS